MADSTAHCVVSLWLPVRGIAGGEGGLVAKLRTKIEVPRLRFRSGASQVERMDTEVA